MSLSGDHTSIFPDSPSDPLYWAMRSLIGEVRSVISLTGKPEALRLHSGQTQRLNARLKSSYFSCDPTLYHCGEQTNDWALSSFWPRAPSFEILRTVAIDTEDENTPKMNNEQYVLSFRLQRLGATYFHIRAFYIQLMVFSAKSTGLWFYDDRALCSALYRFSRTLKG